jgi:hypothetical protein
MPLNANQRISLLDAIETDSLVFLCGAGLSMAPPSSLPSAARVANTCYDKRIAVENLAIALRDDIDSLAAVFYDRGIREFENVFVPLVPWNELLGMSNDGHAAIADLLTTRAAHSALSANFDRMIEACAQNLKVDLRGALDGQQAQTNSLISSPLIKIHGCIDQDRQKTIWTRNQLADPVIEQRITSCSNWLNLNLPGKHLVVVGFWTDWDYLNQVFEASFTARTARAVTVIDPEPTANLQEKARELWDKLHALSADFDHIQESGATVLAELRREFSMSWVRRFYAFGQPVLDATDAAATTVPALAAVAPANPSPDTLDTEALFDLRRDVEGLPYTRAATTKTPPAHSEQASYLRLALLQDGANEEGSWLRHRGTSIRIVNGGGRFLETVRSSYVEPPTMPEADIIVSAGSVRSSVPPSIIAKGRGLSIVRPSAGTISRWLTLDEAVVELNI